LAGSRSGQDDALEAALAALRRRDHSVHELDERLRHRGFPEAAREGVVRALLRTGLLDDARFAEARALQLAGRGSGGDLPLGPALIILFAATCWGYGSFIQPRLLLPDDVFVTTVYEMVCGGLIMVSIGLVSGERFTGDYSPRTWLALGYLVVFGSMLAFTAYVWLLNNVPISLVATYAYVNPVVAVFLGWLILGEAVTVPLVVGGGIVVLAVAIVITAERPRRKPLPETPAPESVDAVVSAHGEARRGTAD